MRKIVYTMKFYDVNTLSDLKEIVDTCERAGVSDSAEVSFGLREEGAGTEKFIVFEGDEA